jgi:signal transduction histidine kinase
MDPLRDLLARKQAELQDRWERQLRAAAEGGFPLDPGTAKILPQLLQSTSAALERRFRGPKPGTGPVESAARKAAVQASLLCDFVYDAALEGDPLAEDEKRRLSDALAHAAVEVQVKNLLDADLEGRRRAVDRYARVEHALRNSMTVAQLALDLLRRRGEVKGTRAATLLGDSISRLRAGLESTLLEELLAGGGLRHSRVKLDRMLAEATDETAPEAQDRGVNLRFAPPGKVELSGDPRVLRTGVRAFLRAAVDLSRRGATIQVDCARRREAARIAVVIDRCRRKPGGGLNSVGGLGLVRRAARAHGGEVRVRGLFREGCTLTFDVPVAPPPQP